MVIGPVASERFLPSAVPVALLDAEGRTVPGRDLPMPADDVLLDLYRMMVRGRRFDTQATALTKQGRLAVYPSARGQEACQVGAVSALQNAANKKPLHRVEIRRSADLLLMVDLLLKKFDTTQTK